MGLGLGVMAEFYVRQGLTLRQPPAAIAPCMVDYFAIVATHGVMALALWRLLQRDELDREEGNEAPRRPRKQSADV
jgi:hypothetical protein